jgi:hypothetical protein
MKIIIFRLKNLINIVYFLISIKYRFKKIILVIFISLDIYVIDTQYMAKIIYIKEYQFNLTNYNLLLKIMILSHYLFLKIRADKYSTAVVVAAA